MRPIQQVSFDIYRQLLAKCLILLLSVLGLGLSGCSYFFGSKARPPSIELKQKSVECLTRLKENMKAWANTGEPAMDQQIDCIISGVDQFAKQTVGRSGDGWSKSELSGFFDTYFPAKDGESSTKWIEEILKIKQAWFGGFSDRVTRAELDRVREFLLDVKPDLAAISPYAPSLFLKELKTAEGAKRPVDAELVARHLKRIGETILDEISRSPKLKATYQVESILELLGALRILEKGKNGHSETRRSILAESLKDLAVGGSPRSVAPTEWARLIPALASGWGLAIRFKYQILRDDVSDTSADQFATEALQLFKQVVSSQGDNGLRFEKIEDLVRAYSLDGEGKSEPIAIANSKIRVSTLTGLIPLLFEKMLVDRTTRARIANDEKTVRLEHVDVLSKYLNDWLAGRRILSDAYGDRTALSPQSLLKSLQFAAGHETAEIRAAREQLLSLLRQGRIPIRDENARPMIVRIDDQPNMKKSAANHYNFARVIVTALFRAYATDRNRTDRLTKKEIESIYWDVREVGIDFNMIDVRNAGSGPRTFLEASIFTSVSRGDSTVSIGEIVEWYHLALGASGVGDKIYDRLEANCSTGEIDVYGRKKIRVECLRLDFWKDLTKNLPNLPGLVAYYKSASSATQAEFRNATEDAGRPLGAASQRSVDSSEIRSIVPILHYTENLMMNHDLDGDGTLDTDEVWKAYPTFRGLISEMAGDSHSELINKTIFSYLLTFGAPPTPGFFGNAGMLAWVVAKTLWSESADRLKILKIIASFNIVGRQKKQEVLEKYLSDNYRKLPTLLDDPSTPEVEIAALGEAFGCRTKTNRALAEQFRREALNLLKRAGANQQFFVSEMKSAVLRNPDFDLRCESF